MKYAEKTSALKHGAMCLLRSPGAADAEDILRHLIVTSAETDFMARYADEITMTVLEEAEFLSGLEAEARAVMISAFVDGKLAANAGISPVSSYERHAHRAEFGISIKKAYWGMGVGSAVLAAVIEAAGAAGYEQMELSVVTGNERAAALYRKFGFKIYGTRQDSFRYRDGTYASEHLMALRL